jgi:hypothetical protein
MKTTLNVVVKNPGGRRGYSLPGSYSAPPLSRGLQASIPLTESALPAAISPMAVLPDLPPALSLKLTLCAKLAGGSA